MSGAAHVQLPPGTDPSRVAQDISDARARASIRFRVVFALTWVLLIGGLAAALTAGGQFDGDFMAKTAPFILGGVPMTIFIAVLSIALAVVLALLGSLGRLSRSAPIYAIATLYVSLVRGTPLIVQIFFLYLALPQVVPAAAAIPLVGIGIMALAFNYGAYMSEVFRAGIQAVPRGQRDAAEALGLPESLVMRRVVLPQAIRIVIPAVGNEFISMLKDSALVSIIGIQELLWRANMLGSSNFKSFETLTTAALAYWVMTIVFSLVQEGLERRMAAGDR